MCSMSARVAERLSGGADGVRQPGPGPGAERFCRAAADAGACGLIVPDLPTMRAASSCTRATRPGSRVRPMAAPNTPEDRLEAIGADARGFVYTVSLAGTTGERGELPAELAGTVARVRAAAKVPVAVGFGIANGDQARRVAELADGVIVGSRIVRAAGEGGPGTVREVVGDLADALR